MVRTLGTINVLDVDFKQLDYISQAVTVLVKQGTSPDKLSIPAVCLFVRKYMT